MVFEVLIDLLLFVGGFLAGYRGLLRMRSGGGARKVLDGVRVGAGPFRSAVVRDLPPPDAENPACGRCAGDGAPMLHARQAPVGRRRERRSAISIGHAALFAVAMVATAVAAVARAEDQRR